MDDRRSLVHYPPEVPSFYRGHKVLTLGLYFYNIVAGLWVFHPPFDRIMQKVLNQR